MSNLIFLIGIISAFMLLLCVGEGLLDFVCKYVPRFNSWFEGIIGDD